MTVVLLSGGIDSTVLLAECVSKYGADNVTTLAFSYGQKHSTELQCATYQANKYGVPHKVIDLTAVYTGNSSALLAGNDGNKNTRTTEPDTTVPFRNQLMLTIAAAQDKAAVVAYAGHLGDEHCSYIDCTKQFYDTMGALLKMQNVELFAPFIEKKMVKQDIIAAGHALGVDFKHTWSCYEGGDEPCGKCVPCTDRDASFKALNIPV